jgi:Protein of unknown function (DUF4238)
MVKKKRHHYVWQHYLKLWARKDDQIFCLRKGKIFPSHTKNVAMESDFYKLEPFAPRELSLP